MGYEYQIDDSKIRSRYDSLDDFANASKRHFSHERMVSWAGATYHDALAMCRTGWDAELAEVLSVSESAVELCERTHEVMRFTEPVYDVTGDMVDIGRYLTGEPECMVDWPLQPTSAVGRVITLCSNISASAAIDPEVIKLRGHVVTAFALALSHLGHSIEIWADWSTCNHSENKFNHTRILVKGPDDTLDPARIMFAFAHPAMLRQVAFQTRDGMPYPWNDHRTPCETEKGYDLPDGTIYLGELKSHRNIPDAHEQLKGMLRQVGLLAE